MRIHAIARQELARLRADATTIVDTDGGNPLRCCLTVSAPGETIALVPYCPPGGRGAYAEVGPVFIHPSPCEGWSGDGYPQAYRAWPRVFRAYDAEGRIHAAVLGDGSDAEATIDKLLADDRVELIQARAPLHGCLTFTITR